MDTNTTKRDLAKRCSVLYYENDMSQNEIAKSLGISRSYVSQLLSFAKEQGIVRIYIDKAENYIDELLFAKKYGLKQIFVLRSESEAYTELHFGKFCAPHTMRLIRNAKKIGVNLGKSVYEVISNIAKEDIGDCSVEQIIQVMGGCTIASGADSGLQPSEMVYNLGKLLSCSCLYLECPAVVNNKDVKEILLLEATINRVFNEWKNVDVVLMGSGIAGDGMIFGSIGGAMLDTLLQSDACADVNLNFFDANGKYISLFDDQKMCMTYEELKNVSMKAVFAYGEKKALPILASMRAGIIDVLFTDSLTMNEIILLNQKSIKN